MARLRSCQADTRSISTLPSRASSGALRVSTGHNVNQRASRAMSRKPAEGIEHQGRGEQVEARRAIGAIGVFLEKGENEARQGEAKLATVGRGRRSAKTEGGLGSIFIREGRNGRRGREGASRPWQEPARQETDIPSRSSTRLLVPNTDFNLQLSCLLFLRQH